jgi:hypothetical protein
MRGSPQLEAKAALGFVILVVALVLISAGVASGAGPQSAPQPAGITARPASHASRPRVKLPGEHRFSVLTRAERLPKGTVVDVSGKAAIELFDTRGDGMTFSGQQPGSSSPPDGVASLFVYTGVASGYIELTMVSGDFAKSGRFGTRPKPKPERRLWGSGKGHFSITGRFAAGLVRGTIWEMADYVNGSLCADKRGLVAVHDLVKHTSILLRTGQNYFARSS